jgi:hypothetical protein
MDMNEFRRRGHEAVERIARYYEELEQYRGNQILLTT